MLFLKSHLFIYILIGGGSIHMPEHTMNMHEAGRGQLAGVGSIVT